MANGGGAYVNAGIHWQRQSRRRPMRCQGVAVEWARQAAGLREAPRRQGWWDGCGDSTLWLGGGSA